MLRLSGKTEFWCGKMGKERNKVFEPGDWIVYHKTKWSTDPGPRAQDVRPAPGGEQYVYSVDKYWVVEEIKDDGSVVLITRRGKRHVLSTELPSLRRANWFERLRYRSRFEAVEQTHRDAQKAATRENNSEE